MRRSNRTFLSPNDSFFIFLVFSLHMCPLFCSYVARFIWRIDFLLLFIPVYLFKVYLREKKRSTWRNFAPSWYSASIAPPQLQDFFCPRVSFFGYLHVILPHFFFSIFYSNYPTLPFLKGVICKLGWFLMGEEVYIC